MKLVAERISFQKYNFPKMDSFLNPFTTGAIVRDEGHLLSPSFKDIKALMYSALFNLLQVVAFACEGSP